MVAYSHSYGSYENEEERGVRLSKRLKESMHGRCIIFYDLVLEVPQYNFLCIIFFKSVTKLSSFKERKKDSGVAVTRFCNSIWHQNLVVSTFGNTVYYILIIFQLVLWLCLDKHSCYMQAEVFLPCKKSLSFISFLILFQWQGPPAQLERESRVNILFLFQLWDGASLFHIKCDISHRFL